MWREQEQNVLISSSLHQKSRPDFISTLAKNGPHQQGKEAKKVPDASKPKINKNQCLREEQAMIAMKFKENINIRETDDGITFYQCNICQGFFTSFLIDVILKLQLKLSINHIYSSQVFRFSNYFKLSVA